MALRPFFSPWTACCFVDMAIQAKLYTDNLGFSFGDLMENACGGFNQCCFSTQQQQNLLQQQQIFPQKIMNQNLMNSSITESVPFSQFLATQMEKQRVEIDQFITLQVWESYFWVFNFWLFMFYLQRLIVWWKTEWQIEMGVKRAKKATTRIDLEKIRIETGVSAETEGWRNR